MTWTYSGDPSTTPRDTVRFLLLDTDASDQLLADEEIEWLLGQHGGGVYEAAAAGARNLAVRYARFAETVTKTVGDLTISESYRARGESYRLLAVDLLATKASSSPPVPWVDPQSIVQTVDKTREGKRADLWVGRLDNTEFP